MRINSKRGDVPLALLVIIALVFAVAALFAFASYGGKFQTNSEDFSKLTFDLRMYEDYIFKSAEIIGREAIVQGGDVEKNMQKIEAERMLRIKEFGNFFGKIRTGEFEFNDNGDGYMLNVNDVFVIVQNGDNSIKRNFDVKIEFDKDGKARNIYK
ncbi:MAG: hypothetical protein AABW80_03880 [Nanoarchaeota archaeon]